MWGKLKTKSDKLQCYDFKCDCADPSHYLSLTWDDEDPTWRYLSFYDFYRATTWRKKFKRCWQILRGYTESTCEVLLDEEAVKGFLEVLSKHSGKSSA